MIPALLSGLREILSVFIRTLELKYTSVFLQESLLEMPNSMVVDGNSRLRLLSTATTRSSATFISTGPISRFHIKGRGK